MSISADNNALVISDVTKKFGKDGGRAWRLPWRKRVEKDDKEPKQVMAVDHISMTVQNKEIFGILILIGLICIPAGLWIFSWGERYAKRSGKLKRNG